MFSSLNKGPSVVIQKKKKKKKKKKNVVVKDVVVKCNKLYLLNLF